MKNVIPTFLLALLTWWAPIADGVGEIDRGAFANREYRNESFGFSLTIPDAWDTDALDKDYFVQVDAVLDQFMSSYEEEKGTREGDSPIYFGLLSSTLPRADSSTAYGIAYFIAYVVDLGQLQGVNGAEEYLRHVESRYPEVEVIQIGEIVSGEFGGRQFYALPIKHSANVVPESLEYATAVNNHVLAFRIVYATDGQLAEARRVLYGIRFH